MAKKKQKLVLGILVNATPAGRRIGRTRLPIGIVSILDNPSALGEAIGELHAYATKNRESNRPRRGIVFRVVEKWEQIAIVQRIRNRFNQKRASEYEGIFRIAVGQLHIIDDSFVSHACNRHGQGSGVKQHLLLNESDFKQIPNAVNPRNIVDFPLGTGTPRIVYEMAYDGSTLVVVEELQASGRLVIKTAYKQK